MTMQYSSYDLKFLLSRAVTELKDLLDNPCAPPEKIEALTDRIHNLAVEFHAAKKSLVVTTQAAKESVNTPPHYMYTGPNTKSGALNG